MHGQIHSALGQRLFDLLGEHSLGAHLCEGHLLQPVPGRLDDLNLDHMALSAKQRGNVVGLPKGQL